MKVIYMNETLVLIQSNLETDSFQGLISSGVVKIINEIPYLVIENKEEDEYKETEN